MHRERLRAGGVAAPDYFGLSSPARAHPRHLRLIAAAIVLTALNLRTAIASVPPLLDELRDAVPLSAAAAGVLTTLPVICMALGSPLAPVVARRVGTEAALALMALTVAAGILVRLLPDGRRRCTRAPSSPASGSRSATCWCRRSSSATSPTAWG